MPVGPAQPRERLLAYIRAHPGSHLRELERGTGLALGVLRHHLATLSEEGLISERRDGRLRRVFPAGLDAPTRALMGALRVRSYRAVASYLLNHAGAGSREIADALSLPQRTVLHYLQALQGIGLVVREAEGYRIGAPDAFAAALAAYKPSFADRLVDAALDLWFESV